MNRQSWLEARRTGIGASDAPAIAGLSPWKTALAVYADKVNGAADHPLTPAQAWGLRLEPAIAAAYSEQTGIDAIMPPPWPVRCRRLSRLVSAES